MFIVMSRDKNTNAKLAEAVKDGDAVILTLIEGELQAKKQTAQGGAVHGFATVVKSDPNRDVFPIKLSDFKSNQDAFAGREDLDAGDRVLIEQGQGTAKTNRVQPGAYGYQTELTAHGDGTLEAAASGDVVIAKSQEVKVIAAVGDELEIHFFANAPYAKA